MSVSFPIVEMEGGCCSLCCAEFQSPFIQVGRDVRRRVKLKFESGLIQIASLRFVKALGGIEDYMLSSLNKLLPYHFISFVF